ncbi:unnamed protein product [Allacma fusca]|uniref:SET domain-containing protein n=1 Tax=Allacma fusca TaxID=39272 RepID=A0A8J2LK01_9HEXA|nr:unnamed protein product [Allacma fusca]
MTQVHFLLLAHWVLSHKTLDLFIFLRYYHRCCHCSQAKFCSEGCSLKAWEIYHQYECGNLDLLQSVGIAHLALKVLLTAGKDQVLKVCSTWGEEIIRDKNIFNKDQPPYTRVYSLLDHIDVMPPEDMFQYSLTASLLVNFLMKRTNLFNDCLLEDVYTVGGVLLKHICQLICNAHAITSIAADHHLQFFSVTTTQESQIRIASAIYPSASMMNHSCDPNIASSFIQGRTLVVRVTTDLNKGSQIFNCYGPHVRRLRRETRQENLTQQYFFECDCNSCEKEAEDGFSFVDTFQALQCSKCSGPIIPDVTKQSFLVNCQDCGKFEDIEVKMRASLQVDQIISVASNFLEEGRTANALEILSQGYKIGSQHLFKYNSDYGQMCDMLGRCYAVLGNFDEAIHYVHESMNYVEQRFGETSIEYARELRKLSDLLKLCTGAKSHEQAMIIAMEKSDRILKLYENENS